MTGTNFSEIAKRYERDSLIQKSAAEKLLSLLAIGGDDRILDLGCGAGNLTRKLRKLTSGLVVGIDQAPEMIRQAQKSGAKDIEFRVAGVEGLADTDAFDVIFCNSAFQWFPKPGLALANCFRALKNGGRMGIQAPAKKEYCPNFLEAVAEVACDTRTAGTFANFRSPWLFFDSAGEYAELFERAGFEVRFGVIEEQITHHDPGQVMAIFESGAAAGYLNPDCYRTNFGRDYVETFREIVAHSFRQKVDEAGRVSLLFNRIYLVGEKP